jgi:DNA-binding CsgD family transcriptional regulator
MYEGVSDPISHLSYALPTEPSPYAYLLPGRRRTSKAALLTSRQIEVLGWAAKGKTDWQIAQILLISRKTANYHIERAKQNLQVSTRMQAVLAAVRLGLMPSSEQQ